MAIVALFDTIMALVFGPDVESNDANDAIVFADVAATGSVSRDMPAAADVLDSDDVETDVSWLAVVLSSDVWCNVLSVDWTVPPAIVGVDVILVNMLLNPAELLMFCM